LRWAVFSPRHPDLVAVKTMATTIVMLALIVVTIFQLRYRSWPFEAPHQLTWCGTGWSREAPVKRPSQLYFVGRHPPLIGPRFYSPYSPAQRRQLEAGDMGAPCGAELLAHDGQRFVHYGWDVRVGN
jgi:hypothetical protein